MKLCLPAACVFAFGLTSGCSVIFSPGSSGEADGGGADAMDADAGPEVSCRRRVILDSFAAGEWEPVDLGATVMSDGDTLTIMAPPGVQGALGYYQTVGAYDLSEGEVRVDVELEDNPAGQLRIGPDLESFIFVRGTPSELRAGHIRDGTAPSKPYACDAISCSRWRIRGSAGRVFPEVAVPSFPFIPTLEPLDVPTDLANSPLWLIGGQPTNDEAPPGGTVTFKNFEASVAPLDGGTRWCKAERLSDDFGGAELGPLWQPFVPTGGTVIQEGGAVVVEPDASGNHSGIFSVDRFDLRESSVVFDVDLDNANANMVVTFQVALSPLDFVPIQIRDNQLCAQGSNCAPIPSGHHIFRIGHTDGEGLFVESSDGAGSPTRYGLSQPTFSLESVDVWFYASATGESPGQVNLLRVGTP